LQSPGIEIRFCGPASREKKLADTGWTDWRGRERRGHADLPDKLPALQVLWKTPLSAPGLGGVAVNDQAVVISDREIQDTTDAWKAYRPTDGQFLWAYRIPAPGNLDYGNSPRANPVITEDKVIVFGAFGHLACLQLTTGKAIWEMNLRDEFEPTDEPKWGACSTPLVIQDRLIVNPGAKDASLAALDLLTGKTLWKTPGSPAGYGSFIAMMIDGDMQIIGHDKDTLGGWSAKTGQRIWTLRPDQPNDFNVPTPIAYGERLIVTTENNGTRLYAFAQGKIIPKPVATTRRLAPDTHTPVVVRKRLIGFGKRLHCFDIENKFQELWESTDRDFTKYCALVSNDQYVLMITMDGVLILFDATTDNFTPISRLRCFEEEKGLYSHPAFFNGVAYLRGSGELRAIRIR
jgi:outer membrane protein assembly factor BamB